jgi:Right handed beta helix region/Bacterial Ig-like domain
MKVFQYQFLVVGFLVGCLIPVTATPAATYYVDQKHASASDSNPGTEEEPFLTIGKGVSVAQPGDTVLVKEGLYREIVNLPRSGTAENPITLRGASGKRVIVSGADEVAGWTQCTQEIAKGNANFAQIYYADIGWEPPRMYQDDTPLMKAREPSAGWFLAQGGTIDTLVDAVNLTQPDDYWVGAEIYLVDRSPSSRYIKTITDFVQSTHTLTANEAWGYDRVPAADDPYYLRNKIELLDGEGQWAVEDIGGEQYRVYVWPFGGGDPDGNYMMEANSTRRRFVINLSNMGYWVIDNLEVRHGQGHGVGEWTSGGPGYNTIQNCSIHHNGGAGIYSRYNDHLTCRRNLLVYNQYGIEGFTDDLLFEENEVAHNEVDGVHFCGDNLAIRRNHIYNHSWYWAHADGFQCHSSPEDVLQNILLEENLMVHAGQTVMMDNCHGVTFRGNVMMGATAYMLVFSSSTPPTNDVTIESNTFYFSGYGLINMRADDVHMKNNIFFKGHGGWVWGSSPQKVFTSDYNLFYHAEGINEADTSTVNWDGVGYTLAGYATASGHDTHSVYGNPQFANAPVYYISLSRGTRNEFLPTRVYLRDAGEIGYMAVGDHVEIDFDGVVRTVTAVGADYVDFEPGDWRITWKYGCLSNWKTNDNFTLDLTLQAGSPAKGAGEGGADMGSPINVLQFVAGDFDGDDIRDIPAWPYVGPLPFGVTDWQVLSVHGAVEMTPEFGEGYVHADLAGATRLRLSFNRPVDPATVTQSSVTITGVTHGDQAGKISSVTLVDDNKVLSVVLSEALSDADRYTVTVASAIRADDGSELSGSKSRPLAVLAGDVDASGTVTAADVVATRDRAAQAVDGETARYDVNGSGGITGDDMQAVRLRLENQLP